MLAHLPNSEHRRRADGTLAPCGGPSVLKFDLLGVTDVTVVTALETVGLHTIPPNSERWAPLALNSWNVASTCRNGRLPLGGRNYGPLAAMILQVWFLFYGHEHKSTTRVVTL